MYKFTSAPITKRILIHIERNINTLIFYNFKIKKNNTPPGAFYLFTMHFLPTTNLALGLQYYPCMSETSKGGFKVFKALKTSLTTLTNLARTVMLETALDHMLYTKDLVLGHYSIILHKGIKHLILGGRIKFKIGRQD